MARPSNFKGQVVAQGGECRKFALWLKHCSRAFNGDVTRDPFCFQKFGLTSIKQIVKGEEYPYETLQLVQNNGTRDNLGYFRFPQASGAWCKKKGNMVELGDWGQGKNCTLYMFDNVANGCADSQRPQPQANGRFTTQSWNLEPHPVSM